MSSSRTLLILACLFGFQGCSPDTAEAPPPEVVVSQDGMPLKGLTDFSTQFGGTLGLPGPVSLTFSVRFDPVPQAADDEYVLIFSIAFPDGRVLAPGNAVDLSAATGLFVENCFCLTTPHGMTARGSLALQTASDAQMTGALDAVFTLTDPLGPGFVDYRGRIYSLVAQSFIASPAPTPAPAAMNASGFTSVLMVE